MKITPEDFIEIDITEEMYESAERKAVQLGQLKNSIRKGQGNLAGFLGEEVVLEAWPGSTSSNTYNHDVMYEATTFEVKTKDRTVSPRVDYEASVANFNTRQVADFYVFVSLLRDKKTNRYIKGYVCGIIKKEQYKDNCHFYRVGDIDPSNGWKVKADCYNLSYERITRFGIFR